MCRSTQISTIPLTPCHQRPRTRHRYCLRPDEDHPYGNGRARRQQRRQHRHSILCWRPWGTSQQVSATERHPSILARSCPRRPQAPTKHCPLIDTKLVSRHHVCQNRALPAQACVSRQIHRHQRHRHAPQTKCLHPHPRAQSWSPVAEQLVCLEHRLRALKSGSLVSLGDKECRHLRELPLILEAHAIGRALPTPKVSLERQSSRLGSLQQSCPRQPSHPTIRLLCDYQK